MVVRMRSTRSHTGTEGLITRLNRRSLWPARNAELKPCLIPFALIAGNTKEGKLLMF